MSKKAQSERLHLILDYITSEISVSELVAGLRNLSVAYHSHGTAKGNCTTRSLEINVVNCLSTSSLYFNHEYFQHGKWHTQFDKNVIPPGDVATAVVMNQPHFPLCGVSAGIAFDIADDFGHRLVIGFSNPLVGSLKHGILVKEGGVAKDGYVASVNDRPKLEEGNVGNGPYHLEVSASTSKVSDRRFIYLITNWTEEAIRDAIVNLETDDTKKETGSDYGTYVQYTITMNQSHRGVSRSNRGALENDLDLDQLFPHMIKAGIMDDDRQELINSKPSKRHKSSEFLKILERRGPIAFTVFANALSETQPHLADMLVLEEEKKQISTD